MYLPYVCCTLRPVDMEIIMRIPLRTSALLLIGVLFLLGVTVPLWRPLFVTNVVNEAFPLLPDSLRPTYNALTADQRAVYETMAAQDVSKAGTMVGAAIGESVVVPDETMMPDAPQILSMGAFVQIDVIHGAEGTATIYRLSEDSLILRFDNFRATNGPDLHVLLSPAEAPRNFEELGSFIDLGSLRGNIGNQNYTLPPELNVSAYKSVVIFCVPFRVVFSTATLTRQ
jgi:hypothetical protein